MLLGRVKYSKASRLAESWEIAKGVLIDPRVSYGKPVVEGAGVATFIVANHYFANRNDAAFVARLYGLSPADVLHAVSFENSLKRPAA